MGHTPPDWLNILVLSFIWRQAPWVLDNEPADQALIDLWMERIAIVMMLQNEFAMHKGSRRVIGVY